MNNKLIYDTYIIDNTKMKNIYIYNDKLCTILK